MPSQLGRRWRASASRRRITTTKAIPAPAWRDDRRPRRPRQAHVERVHKGEREDEVDDVGGEQDHERCPIVGRAPLNALGSEGHEHEGDAERGDAQVLDRRVVDGTVGAEQSGEAGREDEQQRRGDRADDHRQPHRLDADRRRVIRAARADPVRDAFGRAVGEEVRAGDDEREHRDGDGDAAELVGTDAPDDRRVDEAVQRLDGERAEGGHTQRDDPAIGRTEPQPHVAPVLVNLLRPRVRKMFTRTGQAGSMPMARWARSRVAEATLRAFSEPTRSRRANSPRSSISSR